MGVGGKASGQLGLFGPEPDAPPPARDTDTSQAAAQAIAASAPRLRRLAFEAIRSAGADGMTADECAQRLRLSVLTVRPRVSELAKAGRVSDCGKRRVNRSGRRAIVWVTA